jgi:hypothetical protein
MGTRVGINERDVLRGRSGVLLAKAIRRGRVATRKKKAPVKIEEPVWPKVVEGRHSTRIEHEDGSVEMFTDYEKLLADVKKAIAEYEKKKKKG